MKSASARRHAQRGFTLATTLIFLMIFMISAVSLVGASIADVKVASNQQFQLEAHTVAQQGIEQIVSQPFTQTVIGGTTPVQVALYGATNYTAQVAAPICLAIVGVPTQTLDSSKAADKACIFTMPPNPGGVVTGAGQPTSAACSDTQWDVQSSVTDTNLSAAQVVLHQGISARMFTPSALAQCH